MISLIHHPDGTKRLGDLLVENLLANKWLTFRAAVAWAKRSGTQYLVEPLKTFGARGTIKISIGIDNAGTSFAGLSDLFESIQPQGEIWVFHNEAWGCTFHPKLYLFTNDELAECFIGSGNLTKGGLFENYEAIVHLQLDRNNPDDKNFVADVELLLDEWTNPAKGIVRKLTSDILNQLRASGDLPSEAEINAKTRQAKERQLSSPAQVIAPGLFASVHVKPAPHVKQQLPPPTEVKTKTEKDAVTDKTFRTKITSEIPVPEPTQSTYKSVKIFSDERDKIIAEVEQQHVSDSHEIRAPDEKLSDVGRAASHTPQSVRSSESGKIKRSFASPAVNYREGDGRTQLHHAVLRNNHGVAKQLLVLGADVNAKDNNGGTLLHYAASRNYKEMAKLLLVHGADASIKDKKGRTPLHWRCFSIFSTEGRKSNVPWPQSVGDWWFLQELLKRCDVNARDKNGWTPLHIAAQNGRTNIVKVLIQCNGDVNAKDKNDWTPLHIASQKGHTDTVKKLIQYNAVVNARTKDCMTPLHCAAWSGQHKVIELLTRNRGEVNVRTEDRMSPLHFAAKQGHISCVTLLLTKEAKVNAKDIGGKTPLRWATEYDNTEIVDFLREHGGKK